MPELLNIIYELKNTLIAVTAAQKIKIILFLKALPIMALIILIFVVDGLVKRDIRKFQCARESTYLFHRPKPILSFCFYVPLFVYFVSPTLFDPEILFISIAVILGLIAHVMAKSFKKYL